MTNPTATYLPPNTLEELALAWIRRARESQFAHYEQATNFRRLGMLFGVPVIVITAIVGTTVFSSVAQEATSTNMKIAVGLLSVAATVLSSLQTFMKLPEKAEQHRVFGAKYGAIRRRLEQLYASRDTQQITQQVLDLLNKELSDLAEEAPDVPAKALRKVQARAQFLQPTSAQTTG